MKNQKNIKVECEFCGGKGQILRFAHVENGICYGCDGKGYNLVTEEQADKLKEERRKANMFDMVLFPASTNTYRDKEIIKSLGFKFKSSCGWVMFIEVESVEEGERLAREVGEKAKNNGLHGVILQHENVLENIQSARHAQRVITNTINKRSF